MLRTLKTFAFRSLTRRSRRHRLSESETLESRVLLAAPSPVELTALNGTNGIQIDGFFTQNAGLAVSNAGDVNGDGFDDAVIGSPTWEGRAYVVFGSALGISTPLDLSTLDGTNGFLISGYELIGALQLVHVQQTGHEVSGGGDINGDGYDDLIIGARNWQDTPQFDAVGATYVVFGHAGPFAPQILLSSLDGANGFEIVGIHDTGYASTDMSVDYAGDVNGDGFDDVIIGRKDVLLGGVPFVGQAYVVFGQASGFGPQLFLADLDGTNGFRIHGATELNAQRLAQGGRAGTTVAGVGDVNGDGFDDVAVGAPDLPRVVGTNPFESLRDSGAVYLVFGKASGFSADLFLSSFTSMDGAVFRGEFETDDVGTDISAAGDVDGDGYDDFLVNAARSSIEKPNTITSRGETFLVYGRPSFTSNLIQHAGTTRFRLTPRSFSSSPDQVASAAGDVNGDGFDDLLLTERGRYDSTSMQQVNGTAYVVFGDEGGLGSLFDLSTLSGNRGFQLIRSSVSDPSRLNPGGGGDFNGDGFGDLIIGADQSTVDGVIHAGSTYVIFGGNFTGGTETQVGDANANTLTANQGPSVQDILIGGQGNDFLISDGGEDVLIGSQGSDHLTIPDADFTGVRRIVGGNGTDRLILNGTGQTLDLTTIPDNRIVDIEQIQLTGTNNTLILDVQEVLNISGHSNTLVVYKTGTNFVSIGAGWTQQPTELINSTAFQVFTQGAAILKVQFAVPPVIRGFPTLKTYVENNLPVLIAPNASFEDLDTMTFNGGTLTTSVINAGVGDALSLIDFRDVSLIGNDIYSANVHVGTISGAGTPALTMTFNANAGVMDVGAALNAVAFSNGLDNPTPSNRVIEWTANDGDGGIATPVTQDVGVVARPDRAVVSHLGGPVTFTEDAGPILLTSTGTLTDPDQHTDWNVSKLNIRVSRNSDSFDRLTIHDQGTGSGQISVNATEVFYEGTKIGNWNGGIGTNRLQINFATGSTTASIQSLIRAIQFENLIDLPIVASKDIRFELTDPENFANIVVPNGLMTVNMQGTNDLSSLSGISATPSVYNEGGAPRTIGTGGIVTDDDYNGTGFLRVTIAAGGEINDRLTILNQGDGVNQIGVTSNQLRYSGVLIGMIAGGVGTNPLQINFNANATRAGVQAALRLIQYSNASDNPSTAQRQFDFLFNDGDGADSNVVSAFVNVNATNDASEINNIGGDVATTTGANVRVAQAVGITDIDSPDFAGGLFRATISSGQQAGDTLSLFNDATISVVGSDVFYLGANIGTLSTNATSLTVLLNVNATATMVQRLGRNLEFAATSTGTRAIRYQVLDGDGGNTTGPDKNVVVS